MMTTRFVTAATIRAPRHRLRAVVLSSAVLVAASVPVVGFSQTVTPPEVVPPPAVGVAPPWPETVPQPTPLSPQPPQAPLASALPVAPPLASPVSQPAVAPALVTARVLSVTSMAQPASATRQVCADVAEVPVPTSGAGALAGAVVGAAVGSQIGGGAGNALATAAGLAGGALMGDKVEQGGRTQPVRRCVTHSGVGPSLAYQVVYEFGGQPFSTMMPYHPGATVQLQVSPVVMAVDGTSAAAPPLPAAVAHTVVVAPAHSYHGPYGYSTYAPYWGAPAVVGVGVGVGFGRHRGGRPYRGWHGHRRW